jgi:hypothetical protein
MEDYMRKIEVGDRVRFGVDDEGWPVWNINNRNKKLMAGYAYGVVSHVTNFGSLVVEWGDDDEQRDWCWPQRGEHGSLYGLPGYLELVE